MTKRSYFCISNQFCFVQKLKYENSYFGNKDQRFPFLQKALNKSVNILKFQLLTVNLSGDTGLLHMGKFIGM